MSQSSSVYPAPHPTPFVYPTMPHAAFSLTAMSITMAALYVIGDCHALG